MAEIERVIDEMTRGFEKEPWHGPGLMEILEDITPAQAAARPIKDTHSIWELVMHLDTWTEEITKRIGGYTGYPTDEENFPPMPEPTEENWRETIAHITKSQERLREAVRNLDESKLDSPLVPKGSPAYHQFHGHAQHLAYHGGQIVMLKKLVQ